MVINANEVKENGVSISMKYRIVIDLMIKEKEIIPIDIYDKVY